MSERAEQFVAQWVESNASADDYVLESDNTEARTLASGLLNRALEGGIPRSEIEESTGDVVSFLAEEIKRLAGKDR